MSTSFTVIDDSLELGQGLVNPYRVVENCQGGSVTVHYAPTEDDAENWILEVIKDLNHYHKYGTLSRN